MRLFTLMLLASAIAQAQATGAVAGRVFCADTHTPCRFATVTIQTAPPRSNEGGPLPKAGPSRRHRPGRRVPRRQRRAWRILHPRRARRIHLAIRPGRERGRGRPGALNRVTVTADGTATENLSLARGASLAGTVQYDDGGLGIRLAYYLYCRDSTGKWKLYHNHPGDSSLAPLGLQAHTDDRGHFYEPALPPGTYTVDVELPAALLLPDAIQGTRALTVLLTGGGALRTYYGNRPRLHQATPIELTEGADRSGVDITIPINGLHSVSGALTSKQDRRAFPYGAVRLLDPDDKTVLRETFVGNDGSFAFQYVAAGTYLVEIDPHGNGNQSPVPYEAMTAPIQVETDLAGLTYALKPVKASPVR